MMLLMDEGGMLVVYGANTMIPLDIKSLDELHKEMERYDVSFISPSIESASLYTKDEELLKVIHDFNIQRAQLKIGAAFRKKPIIT
jgi:hypothetical protein